MCFVEGRVVIKFVQREAFWPFKFSGTIAFSLRHLGVLVRPYSGSWWSLWRKDKLSEPGALGPGASGVEVLLPP